MTRRKLPIGIQTFREIREEGCYYVDKTGHARRLAERGKHYFLSRPRRFGKSLFLDTLKELFEGNEALFRGLDVHDHWAWSVRHPVLRLDFSGGDFSETGYLQTNVMAQLGAIERRTGVGSEHATAPERLGYLIEMLRERAGQRVVVLVDEYDKPIRRIEVAGGRPGQPRLPGRPVFGHQVQRRPHPLHVPHGSQQVLEGEPVLGPEQPAGHHPGSALRVRLHRRDLDTVFAAELPGLDRVEIRDWYNGYNWRGEERVYNPFDILLLFERREFGAWWFETGTPTFLIDTLMAREVGSLDLDGMIGSDDLLSAFDVDDMATEALLFQTGYLTIRRAEPRGGRMFYRLGYPNREVRQSLNDRLLRRLTGDAPRRAEHSARLYDLLLANDFEGLETLFHAFFSSIPYEWHTRNEVARYEGYYASVFYSYFAGLGLDVTVEDSRAAAGWTWRWSSTTTCTCSS